MTSGIEGDQNKRRAKGDGGRKNQTYLPIEDKVEETGFSLV